MSDAKLYRGQHQRLVAPPTRLLRNSDGLAEYELELLHRLQTSGQFKDEQMLLIEQEVRALSSRKLRIGPDTLIGPGDQIGNFVVRRLLARGGEGAVFIGRDLKNHEPVAIKILENMRMSRRFRREMDLVQQLAHPNIVTAYEVAEFQGIPYIAMELLEGPDLNALVELQGTLAWLESARVVVQISRALVHAHERGLTHRDIKPANIIRNGQGCVKLVDLGLAAMRRTADETAHLEATQEAQVAGTLPFMAPEQASSLTTADKQSDIYSLGATWFYLLTGKSRLPGRTLAEQFSNLLVKRRFRKLPDDCLPPSLMRIYERMVAYSPSDRYNSTRQLNHDLECALRSYGYAMMSNKITVLVIEDSQIDMLRTLEILRKTNTCLSLHQATTLREGLNTYRCGKIDLALLDLNLPDSDGVETVRRFRKVAPEIPVVVLSGTNNDALFEGCMQAGCRGFIPKFDLTAHKIERMIFVTLSKASPPSVASG